MLQPGEPDSGGAQFFVCVTDQPPLTGKYTVFGRVAEGMDVVQKISETPASADGVPTERIDIASVEIRDTPPPEPEPFGAETPAQLSHTARCSTRRPGPITIEFFADKAPEHVRAFLRLAAAGVLDGTSFHRVVKGFVIQTGVADHAAARSPRSSRSWCTPCSRSSTTRSTSRASSRWRAATIRRARRPRSSS